MASVIPLLLLTVLTQGPAAPDCPTLLAGLREKIAANYAGHVLEVRGARAAAHRDLLAALSREAAGAEGEGCRVVLQRLVDWYDDPHLFLFQSSRLDSVETRRRQATLARHPVEEGAVLVALAARPDADPIEGIWFEGARRMAVVPATERGRFLAVITASDTTTLPVGAVVARIARTGPGVYRVARLANSLAETVARGTLHREGTLLRLSPGMWGKAAPLPASAHGLLDPADVHRPTLQVRDDAIIIAVPSHDPGLRPVLERLLREHAEALRSGLPLLVDLRGNEGGGSQTTAALMPFLMDATPRPRQHEFTEALMLSSPDQIRYASRSFGPDTSAFVRRLVTEMRAHPGELVPLFDPAERPELAAEVVPVEGPRAVAVLIDRGTVSAAEVTVLEVQRSRRAVVIGEPTAGALDYQNTSIVPIIEGERRWYLGYPTITAHGELPEHGIRGRGIAPDVAVDWSRVDDPYATALRVLAERVRQEEA